MAHPFAVQLYGGAAPGSDYLLQSVAPERLRRPRVSWVEDGGDDSFSAAVEGMDFGAVREALDAYPFMRVTVTDITTGSVAWGGRIEKTGFSLPRRGRPLLRLSALGWYRNLFDQPLNVGYASGPYAPEALVTAILTSNCALLDARAYANIAASGTSIAQAFISYINVFPVAAIAQLCQYGNSAGALGHLYVWNRVPHLVWESNAVTHEASDRANLEIGSLDFDYSDWRNFALVEYNAAGTFTAGAWTTTPYPSWWPARYAFLKALQITNATDAALLGTAYLLKCAQPRVSGSAVIYGNIRDVAGNAVPARSLRPGKVLRLPFLSDAGIVTVADNKSAFRVVAVEYDGESGAARLQLGNPSHRYDIEQARLSRLASG